MALHEMHDLPDGGTVRVAIRRPKRDKRERQGTERPLPHLGNKQKRRQDYDASSFQPSTVQKTEEAAATSVDESTNQTQSFFTTQESTMTQATTQTTQADQTTTQTAAAEQIKDIKKEVQETTKKEEKSSAWKTAGKVVGGIAAVAGLAAGGYFAWKKYGSS
jgi:cobalamin biosynthesis Mg chelatase CobN